MPKQIGYLASLSFWLIASSVRGAGVIAEPQFSVPGGFFDRPIALSISSATPGATIHYSFDCSEPSSNTGERYEGPISIAQTTIVRARAFKEGLAPSPVKTGTFLFLSDVLRQSTDGRAPRYFPNSWGANKLDYGMDTNVTAKYSAGEWIEALTQIPSMSIVTEMKNLFDPLTGIYANALQHGRDWERPASIELLDPAQSSAARFQENCGLRIRGGYSRNANYAKHSFRVFFRREYGVEKLKYRLFEFEGADEFDTFDLRTSQNYSWAIDGFFGFHDTMVQDVFCRETLGALGQPTTRSRYYHLYLNGQYWGLYETQERPEAAYGSSYFGGRKEDYDVVKSANHVGAFVTEVTDGNFDAFRSLWTMTRSLATNASNANYFRILGCNADGTRNSALPVLLEVDNLIDYMLVLFYTGDGDGGLSSFANNEVSNNWFGVRNRNNANLGFMFFNHDAEHTLGSPYARVDRTGPFIGTNQSNFAYANPQWLHQDLMASAEYRLRFADRVQQHFFGSGALTFQAVTNRYIRKANQISKAVRAYSARWGDTQREPPFGETEWSQTITNTVRFWFPNRAAVVLQQLKEDRLYPEVAAPVFGQHGGIVPVGYSVAIGGGSSTRLIYFTTDGTDPRLVGGAISRNARLYAAPLSIATDTFVRARVFENSEWSVMSEAWFFASPGLSGLPRLAIQKSSSGILLGLPALADRRYALRYTEILGSSSSQLLTNLPGAPMNRVISIHDPPSGPRRFYWIESN